MILLLLMVGNALWGHFDSTYYSSLFLPQDSDSHQTASFPLEASLKTPQVAGDDSSQSGVSHQKQNDQEPSKSERQVVAVLPHTAYQFDNQELGVVFQTMGWNRYLMADVLFTNIPSDIANVEPVAKRKQLFIGIIVPVVLHSFGKILRTREFLLDIADETLSDTESARIQNLCKTYRIRDQSQCSAENLLARVDIFPISLVLAQAAIESGWGGSRFAKEGNALFGQWTTATDSGIVPRYRDSGKTHKIKSYKSIEASIDSYLRNLNSHPVYKNLWSARLAVREELQRRNGYVFADQDIWTILSHLEAYSEKGKAYLDLVATVIEQNNLILLDGLLAEFVG